MDQHWRKISQKWLQEGSSNSLPVSQNEKDSKALKSYYLEEVFENVIMIFETVS